MKRSKFNYFFSFLSFCLLFLIIDHANSQALDWGRCYGGSGFEDAYSIIQTSDSGFLVVGETSSDDGLVSGFHPGGNCSLGECTDFWVVKTDRSGNFQWQKTLGGSKADIGYCSIQSGSNYIVAGASGSSDGDLTSNNGFGDGWMVALDSVGNFVWQRSYGGVYNEVIYKLISLPDGSLIAFGRTTAGHGANDLWLFKIDSLGNMLWEKFYGGSGREFPENIVLTADEGFAMFAQSESSDGDVGAPFNNSTDYWLLKVDSSGNIQWSKTYGGSWNDLCKGGCQTDDHGFLITGYTESLDGDVTNRYDSTSWDGWTLRTDSLGNILWKICVGGSEHDEINSVLENSDGEFVSIGYTTSNDGNATGNHSFAGDFLFIQLSQTGVIEASKCFGSYYDEYPSQLIQTMDGGYAIAGETGGYGGDISNFYGGTGDLCILKIFPLTSEVNSVKKNPDFSIYPNPATNYITVNSILKMDQEICLFNIYNECISKIKITSTSQKIDLSLLSGGIYFLRSQNGYTLKFLKM